MATDVSITMDQSEFEGYTCNQRQARENACVQDTIGLGLASTGWENGRTLPTIIEGSKEKRNHKQNYF